MTPIHNGPARNTPKARQTAATPAADPAVCRCPGGRPIPIGHFVAQQLVDVELRHLISTGCGLPPGHVPPRVYQAGIGRGAPLR